MDNQKAIEYFYRQMELGNIKNDTEQEAYELAIQALNSDWIPVSERLPEENKHVLLSLENNEGKKIQVVGFLYFSDKEDFECFNGEFAVFEADEVVPEFLIQRYVKAWKPLLEPYRGND